MTGSTPSYFACRPRGTNRGLAASRESDRLARARATRVGNRATVSNPIPRYPSGLNARHLDGSNTEGEMGSFTRTFS